MSISDFIKKYPVAIYFALTFAISWGLILILVGLGNIPIREEQSSELLPLLYTLMLAGPSVTGILLTGLVDGKAGFRKLLSRLRKWRICARWYAVALLAAPLVASLILLALSLFSSEFTPGIFTSGNKVTFLLSGISVGLMVGIFEEVGWTGFVVPRLKLRYSILTTGLIVGLIWGAWHFILFWKSDSFSGALPLLILLGGLFAWLPPFRVFLVWIYDRTESLPVAMLTHASLVATITILVPMNLAAGLALLTWIIV